jgi:hypothetical protein
LPSLLAQLHAAVGAVLALPQPSSINSQLNVFYGRQLRRLGGGSANMAPPLMAAAHPAARGLLLQHSRCVATLRPYKSAPTPLPRYRKPDKNRRMNRMVIRIPPQVQVAVCDGELRLAGECGGMGDRQQPQVSAPVLICPATRHTMPRVHACLKSSTGMSPNVSANVCRQGRQYGTRAVISRPNRPCGMAVLPAVDVRGS